MHSNQSMIEKAELNDLKQIKTITEACALAMQEQGIFQWNEHYPSTDRLREDILREELFLLRTSGVICGIIVITPEMDEEYITVKWLTKRGNNLYIHRLATHPATWGRGHGRRLMDFAEDRAREKAYDSVRLDTFSRNTRNQKFYESRGYIRLGNIFFPRQSKFPFYCYEKLL